MKRIGSSDSLGALMSISTVDENNQGNNPMYTRDFQTILEGMDEEGCVEESGHVSSEKKRRLSLHQVKALEKNFEVENKLEPERKVQLAGELGLQPRQVAVWFQNRRARWKTKQLERDYGLLKANNDALKHKYEKLRQDNESLLNEIRELKSKLSSDGKIDTKISVKEEDLVVSDNEEKGNLETECDDEGGAAAMDVNLESFNCDEDEEIVGALIFRDLKDGSSDSDSSGILNDYSPHQFSLDIHSGSSSYMNMMSLQFSDNTKKGTSASVVGEGQKMYQTQTQFVKIEEHNFFGEENECSNLFSDDQAPTLHWYSSDDWN